jgi:hypothetical protein
MRLSYFLLLALTSAKEQQTSNEVLVSNYFNYISAGRCKMIPIQTPIGDLKFDKDLAATQKLKSYCFMVVQP